jgi:hypothetical protein
MPYVYIFSIGEALRSGVGPEAHFTPFRTVAYVSLGLAEYQILAPLYFLRLYLNYLRLKRGIATKPNTTHRVATRIGEGDVQDQS